MPMQSMGFGGVNRSTPHQHSDVRAQVLSVPKGKEREMLIDPAIQGTTTLLSARCLLPLAQRKLLQGSRFSLAAIHVFCSSTDPAGG